MAATSTGAMKLDRDLFEAARGGDQDAFGRLVEPYRGELQAHSYRMLGSLHDAEDALQDAFLRAWRALSKLDDAKALRAWLYKITTNASLDAIGRRPKRVLPVDYGPAADPHDGPGEPITEQVWVEPFPDELLALEDEVAAPEARYEQRESVELAFIAALQQLPATQRAVLILREVLGFSAKEVAEALETTTASVNSALQRARAGIEQRAPEQSQQETMRALGDDGVRELVKTYADAWERGDVDTVVSLLAEDATFAMPPLASWFGGRDEIAIFLAGSPLSGDWKWRAITTRANGQVALAFYTWNSDEKAFERFALNVLTLRSDGLIGAVDAFIARATPSEDREVILRTPEQPPDPERMAAAFERFGLPEWLED